MNGNEFRLDQAHMHWPLFLPHLTQNYSNYNRTMGSGPVTYKYFGYPSSPLAIIHTSLDTLYTTQLSIPSI